jgi:hypothetical protein
MKFAIYRGETYLEPIHADDEQEAREIAQQKYGDDVRVEETSEVDHERGK